MKSIFEGSMARILFFGELAEITGNSEQHMVLQNTEELWIRVFEKWPSLRDKTIALAVNRRIMIENVTLSDADEVALMPPFSGG